ncbi:MAG: purine-nucleoside phosphorylase [Bacteroidetes bacterium QH_10_64_19]|nr:MAG: purine-nucleoside phosphorylase [Bacteroidetes bacterium QH_10_64_19]
MSTASDPSALTAEGTAAYRGQVEDAASSLPRPSASLTVGVVHDTESDDVLDEATTEATVSCADIPHFPAPEGTLRTGTVDGTGLIELNQSLHLYHGHSPREVTFPVRMLATAGVDTLLLTTAAGSVNPQFERGAVMLLTDHINFQGQNPLVGPNVEAWGPRFPDMTEPYDPSLRRKTGDVAREHGTLLRKGIFLALLGPNRETTAEHRMARRLGADAVGTSVVPEVIAAHHMDVRVMALALLTKRHLTNNGTPAPANETDDSLHRSRLHRLLTGVVGRLSTAAPAT